MLAGSSTRRSTVACLGIGPVGWITGNATAGGGLLSLHDGADGAEHVEHRVDLDDVGERLALHAPDRAHEHVERLVGLDDPQVGIGGDRGCLDHRDGPTDDAGR